MLPNIKKIFKLLAETEAKEETAKLSKKPMSREFKDMIEKERKEKNIGFSLTENLQITRIVY